jgi:hypothetical protein
VEQVHYLQEQLRRLRDPNQQATRVIAARKLIYLAQGAWQECSRSEEQLEAMVVCSKQLMELGAVEVYVEALHIALAQLSMATRPSSMGSQYVVTERACGEIELTLTLLYYLMETQRQTSLQALKKCFGKETMVRSCV